jgi:hypothetical protein
MRTILRQCITVGEAAALVTSESWHRAAPNASDTKKHAHASKELVAVYRL